MPENDKAILEQLNKIYSDQVPNSRTITREALVEILTNRRDNAWIKEHFSELVESLQVEAYQRYLKYESKTWRVAFASVFGPKLRECDTPDKVAAVIGNHFFSLDKFFLSRTQSRRSRAGTAFEVVLEELYTRLGYSFDSQPAIDGNPDFVFPSITLYQKHASDAIVFTAKRTLRERWRQIVTEGAKGLGFFLATIDDKISETQIGEMNGARIQIVVPSRLKKSITQYVSARNVITFEDFLEYYLDPKMTKWKKQGDIT
jgi:hypothetical protein